MPVVINVRAIEWEIGKKEMRKYGSYDNAVDAIGLPDSFKVEADNDYNIEHSVKSHAFGQYGHDLIYNYSIDYPACSASNGTDRRKQDDDDDLW